MTRIQYLKITTHWPKPIRIPTIYEIMLKQAKQALAIDAISTHNEQTVQ